MERTSKSSKSVRIRECATVVNFWPFLPETKFHQGVAGCRTPSGPLYCDGRCPDPGPPLVRLAFVSPSRSGNGPRSLTRHRTFRAHGPRPRKPQTPHMSGATGGLGVGPPPPISNDYDYRRRVQENPTAITSPQTPILPTNSSSTYRTLKHHTTKDPTPPYSTQTGIGTTRTL